MSFAPHQICQRMIALNGVFAIDDQSTAMRGSATPPRRRGRRTPQIVRRAEDNDLEAWQSVDSEVLSSIASAKGEGVPLAVAKRVFGEDPTCRGEATRRWEAMIACPPKPWRRREELNEILVA